MKTVIVAALVAGLFSGIADATTLVDLVDAPSQAGVTYTFTLTATSSATIVAFGGYQIPNLEYAGGFVFAGSDAVNLFTGSWDFTPAESGSFAEPSSDGSLLTFGGTTAGAYDVFSQTFATTAGSTYTLAFDFSNYADHDNGFRVTTNAEVSGVPEPGGWALMIGGFGLVGVAQRRTRHVAGRRPRLL